MRAPNRVPRRALLRPIRLTAAHDHARARARGSWQFSPTARLAHTSGGPHFGAAPTEAVARNAKTIRARAR
jgi:hypothetical protein